MSQHPLRIAYVTLGDPHDIRTWSGLSYHIAESLKWQGAVIDYLGPLHTEETLMMRAKRKFYTQALGRNFMEEREPSVTRAYARQVAEKLALTSADVVLSTHTELLADFDCPLPIAYWTDSNFAGMLNFYPYFCNLHPETITTGHAMERRALQRCQLAIYTSEWAANDAIKTYGADPAKVKVVPFGANIICSRTGQDIRDLVAARTKDRCNLLFIGRIWDRKGGDVAMAVAKQLNDSGLPTRLTLIGSQPPNGPLPDYVRAAGFINKSTDEGRKRFDSLVAEAHFLIVPSRAEAFGLVFAEASSFGVPSLTTNVGGIPGVVRDGGNGRMFPLDAPVQAWCDHVRGLMADYPRYEQLALSAFHEYQTRLNWQVNGHKVYELLQEIVRPSELNPPPPPR